MNASDIAEQLMQRSAAPREIAFRDLVESASDVVIVTDVALDQPGPFIRYVNPAFTRLTGWQPQEVVGRSPRILQGPGTDRATTAAIGAALRRGERTSAKILNYARNGAPYWLDLRIVPLFDAQLRIDGFAAFERDVTLDKRQYDELEHLADRDTLTGVPNRRALLRGAEAELASRGDGGFCAAWVDIDHFKRVNDTHGHPAGDAVLMAVADVLAENLRRVDLFGRMGGEEFAICMPGVTISEAGAVAERLRRAVEAAVFPTEVGPLRVTCSIGVTAAQPGEALATLLARADTALYAAKQGGRNRVVAVA
ncbi:sensor domain-containing diguanylate cyclase [Falsiroseomonas tokyonensis]|uniref:Diguanylate cyclase n=1 Tax=Falsiroseomonas tokyonensis TaxID=430521 RepID=A0ABV7BS62_9PROT|nr:diguanylate cyclase [Falsiroseomonas tokyonensis]MBU8537336.1 diguanylate cyclase [Falsiroseomonas tokyonensis]